MNVTIWTRKSTEKLYCLVCIFSKLVCFLTVTFMLSVTRWVKWTQWASISVRVFHFSKYWAYFN